MRRLSPKQTGRAGEHYVAYLLETCGLEALRVDGTGCDLHVTTHAGRVLRLEVKTCATAMVEKNVYRFHIGKSNAEVFAFVAMFDEQPLVRMFLREHAPKWSMNKRDFSTKLQSADLQWFAELS